MIEKLIDKLISLKVNIELVEKDKIKIHTDISKIPHDLLIEMKSRKEDLIKYLIANALSDNFSKIPVISNAAYYELSSSQRRFWIISQFEGGNTAHNLQGKYLFNGEINHNSLNCAFKALIERHESLRTVFRMNDAGDVYQFILSSDEKKWNIDFHDVRFSTNKDEKLEHIIQAAAILPFDLSAGPLIKTSLVQTEDHRYVFIYNIHHIISDGWSMGIILNELLLLYDVYHNGTQNTLLPLRIQYKDYAAWQKMELRNGTLKQQKEYWLKQLEGVLPVLDLKADQIRPAIKTYNGEEIFISVDSSVYQEFKTLVQNEGVTLFIGLFAMINTLLYKYTEQEDIILGTPIAGREHADLENQIGLYINMLALRMQFKGVDSYRELLIRSKQVIADAYSHQAYPFDNLIEDMNLKRDPSRNPLFDIILILENAEGVESADKLPAESDMGTYNAESRGGSKFDMTFRFLEKSDHIQIGIEYNTDIYYENTVNQLSRHFIQLMKAVIANPGIPVAELDYLNLQEKQNLLTNFNSEALAYQKDKTLIHLFEEQVLLSANKIAVVFKDKYLTYNEFNQKANQLGHYLREECQIKRGDRIGICLERSELMLIVIFGVLKSGGVYVPIDPEYPIERIEYILTDSNCSLLINETELHKFNAVADTYNTNNLPVINLASDLAYVIYTSGSTGKPKGVMIEHQSVNAFIQWSEKEFGNSDFDTVFGVTSICFDLSVFEIFFTLISGKRLRLLTSPFSIGDHLASSEKFLLNTVPRVVGTLLKDKLELGAIKVLNMAGEPIPAHFSSYLDCDHMEVRNLYGPTEDTVYSTSYRIYKHSPILIGRPIANTSVYIINANNQLLPPGVIGELCISGDGLARGYLNRPELSTEKFVADPFKSGRRMYRTGDLGRWLQDGNIEFLGRKDFQVKIRGHRIELGEIELALLNYKPIGSTIVISKTTGEGEQELVAYMVSEEKLNISAIRTHLSKTLPGYMLPSHFVQLDQMPVNANGKTDRNLLPDPEGLGLATGIEYIAPRNQTEQLLCAIFSTVLKKENIGIKDNFFILGGDSIKSIHVVSLLRQNGYVLTIGDVMHYPVIEYLVGRLKLVNRVANQGLVIGTVALGPIQRYFLEQTTLDHHHFNQSVLLTSKVPISESALNAALDKLVEHHDTLRMVYHRGLSGWEQENLGLGYGYSIEVVTAIPEDFIFEEYCTTIQSGFDLSAGPLFKAVLFRGNTSDRLLLICHHLVIDGVSWRILFEDLSALYEQYNSGQDLILPQKTDSFYYWQEQIGLYANSAGLEKERTYWKEIAESGYETLSADNIDGSNKMKDAVSASFVLDKELTATLLTGCYRAYQTDTNDILLTGLGLALKDVFGLKKVLINLEGHGREDIGSDVDISRTVGWFTTMYPVLIDLEEKDDLISGLIAVKENLRRVPNKGIGYGILAASGKEFNTLHPEITFNYLGDFGSGVSGTDGQELFSFSGESRGDEVSGEMNRWEVLSVSGIIAEGILRISLTYSREQYAEQRILKLLDAYNSNLKDLILNLSLAVNSATVANTNLTDVSYNQLFYACEWGPEDSVVQALSQYDDIDENIFSLAVKQLISRHESFRTIFVNIDGLLKQKVITADELDFNMEKTIHIDSHEMLDEVIKKEQTDPFDLSKAPLFSVKILKLLNAGYFVLITMRHIISDGYSVGILDNELKQLYVSISQNKEVELKPLTFQYEDFSIWQNTFFNSTASLKHKEYWIRKLNGFNPSISEVSGMNGFEVTNDQNRSAGIINIIIDKEFYQDMRQFSVDHNLTINALLLGGVSIFLCWLTGKTDITLTMAISARYSEYLEKKDISGLIGCFVNLLFVRIKLDQETAILANLKNIQQDFLEDLSYGDYPFTMLMDQLPDIIPSKQLSDSFFYYNYDNYDFLKGNKNTENHDVVDQKEEDSEQKRAGIEIKDFEDSIVLKLSLGRICKDYNRIDEIKYYYLYALKQIIYNSQLTVRQTINNE